MHLVDDPKAPDQGDSEPLGPIVHMLNFKERRALVCRGENAQADAQARGFKAVSSAHFHKYIADAKKGFRQKGAKKVGGK